ncbi:MAG TPA: hypothetical protein VJG32_10075 [Anaerolineae bacterium]|nr:hypothetical protein [Anaerolineae bacterium]
MSLADLAYQLAHDPTCAARVQHELQNAQPTHDQDEIRAVLTVLRDRKRWTALCSSLRVSPDGMPPWYPAQPRPESI